MLSSYEVVDGFPCTILSNAKHPIHENKTSHFYTELESEKDCSGYWEVALLEIDFMKSWYNVPRYPEQERITVLVREIFDLQDQTLEEIDNVNQIRANTLNKISKVSSVGFGNYKIKEFITEMNTHLIKSDEEGIEGHPRYRNYKRHTRFYMDDQSLICSLFVGIGDKVILPEYIANALILDKCTGVRKVLPYADFTLYEFKGPTIAKDDESLIEGINNVLLLDRKGAYDDARKPQFGTAYEGLGVPAFPTDTSNIFIYSNIVDFELVGDIQTRLLRTVTADGQFGDHIKHTFNYPLWKKLGCDRLKDIEIQMRTDNGKFVQFEFGQVMLYLFFRRLNR